MTTCVPFQGDLRRIKYTPRGTPMKKNVDSGYKRQGIGTKLFDSICTWFKTFQVNHVELTVASNNPQSIGFWNKMGGKEFMRRMRIKL